MRRGCSDEDAREKRRVRKLDFAKLPLKRRDDPLTQGVCLRLPGTKRGEYAGLGERDVVRCGVDEKRGGVLREARALRDCGDDALGLCAKRLFVEEVERPRPFRLLDGREVRVACVLPYETAVAVLSCDSARLPALDDRYPVKSDVADAALAGAEKSAADEVDHLEALVLDAVGEVGLKRFLLLARALELEV